MSIQSIANAIEDIQTLLKKHKFDDARLLIGHDFCALKCGDAVIKLSRNTEDVLNLIVNKNRVGGSQLDAIKEIYDAYPRKRDRHAAFKAIKKALSDNEIPGPKRDRHVFLLNAVRLYAASVERTGVDRLMIPYPATWFHRGSYLNSIERKEEKKGTGW
jgi:hypothetical protein